MRIPRNSFYKMCKHIATMQYMAFLFKVVISMYQIVSQLNTPGHIHHTHMALSRLGALKKLIVTMK
jgi:hypothetical protein